MGDFTKIVRIGIGKPEWTRRGYSVFCKIRFKDGCLSISGVEGPLSSGNCKGSCGQIDMHPWHIQTYASGWSVGKENQLREVWERWHMKKDVPEEIIAFLASLPDADKTPAWV